MKRNQINWRSTLAYSFLFSTCLMTTVILYFITIRFSIKIPFIDIHSVINDTFSNDNSIHSKIRIWYYAVRIAYVFLFPIIPIFFLHYTQLYFYKRKQRDDSATMRIKIAIAFFTCLFISFNIDNLEANLSNRSFVSIGRTSLKPIEDHDYIRPGDPDRGTNFVWLIITLVFMTVISIDGQIETLRLNDNLNKNEM